MYEYRHVLVRMRAGESDRALARAGLMGRRKAGEFRQIAAKQGWLEPSSALPDEATLASAVGPEGPRSSSTSLVEPHADEVRRWWSEGIDGTTIHQALMRKCGFSGSYSSVRRFLRRLSGSQPRRTVILDFAPGEAAQVDFGAGPRLLDGGREVRTWIFVMTLCWSRHQYAELVRDQKVATWLACHRRAFEFFGGVPERVIIDNPKCAITRACWREPTVQRAYAELAEGYGFRIDPCPPGEPQKKGRVESGIKYVKRNFLPLRDFRGFGDANRQLRGWVLGRAGNRLHGSTRERPLTRFAETERHLLGELPAAAPEPSVWAQGIVQADHHVRFERARYSVPYRLIGQRLWLRATPTAVQLFEAHTMVATHPRLGPGERSTVDDHLPPEALAHKRRTPEWCRARAETVGSSCREVIEALFADRVLDHLRAAQGVIRLGERYGHERLEAACERALAFDDPRYRSVKTILERGLDQRPSEVPAAVELATSYTGSGRFCRDTRNLLAP